VEDRETLEKKYRVLEKYYLNKIYPFYKKNSKSAMVGQFWIDKGCLQSYQNILKSTRQLLSEISVQNSVQASVVFEYLLWNGYFSSNHYLSYGMEGRINHPSLLGGDIMRGRTACINNSVMLHDLLKEMGYESYVVFSHVLKESETQYCPAIEKNIEKKSVGDVGQQDIKEKLSDFFLKLVWSDHACVLVKVNGQYYVYDPTNLLVFEFYRFLKVRSFCGDAKMRVVPGSLLVFENMEVDDLLSIFGTDLQNKSSFGLTGAKVRELSESAMELCQENVFLFEDFHEDIRKDINGVCKTLR